MERLSHRRRHQADPGRYLWPAGNLADSNIKNKRHNVIALIALSMLGGWIFLSVFLAGRIPRWLGIQRYTRSAGFVCFLLLLLAPAAQDIVGMWQFERLCKERAVVWVSPEARQVKRAKDTSSATVELPGYWITIRSQPVEYSDADTGIPFYRYEILHTKGGVVGEIASLGNTQSCRPTNRDEASHQLNIGKLLEHGK